MKRLWTSRPLDVSAAAAWTALTDVTVWPEWGPTVRSATVDDAGDIRLGATGTVTTVGGVRLPFEVTAFEPGDRWAWKVAGIGATDHRVESLGRGRCRVGFGVPWPAAPYLAVCRVALRRLDLVTRGDEVAA